MNNEVNKAEALEYVLKLMNASEEFKGIERDDINRYVKEAMDADFEYMEQNDVFDGGVYDEDDAYDYIMDTLSKDKDDETAAMISLIVDGYMEYFDEYLEKNDLLDWE